MPRTTPTASGRITSALARGPHRGLTSEALAKRTGIKITTVRTTVLTLVHRGVVSVKGHAPTTVGRPARRYVLSD